MPAHGSSLQCTISLCSGIDARVSQQALYHCKMAVLGSLAEGGIAVSCRVNSWVLEKQLHHRQVPAARSFAKCCIVARCSLHAGIRQ